MPDNTGQSPQTLQNPQGHPVAASPAGQGQAVPSKFDIGAFNNLGVDPTKVAMNASAGTAIEASPGSSVVTPPQGQSTQLNPEETKDTSRQPTEKDTRHFAQAITVAAQQKYDIARLAIETDENAIFKIAETDKDLAQRLLKDYDFGVDTVDDLLAKKDVLQSKNPEETQREINETKWKKDMESQLLEEKILRLKGENPDLIGDVEEKFREIYANPAFKDYSESQKMSMARVLTGKESPQSNADNVALAVLNREQGVVSSPKGTMQKDGAKVISPEMRKMMQSANISEKDLAILPPNMDDLISSMYGPLVGQ